jgi:microcystin-dependent protein
VDRRRTLVAAISVVLAFALILGGQALADATAPDVPNGALTGQAMGRAGFAYLTGLRQFGAMLLWNRLEPQMHQYYGGDIGLGKMTFMLPNVKAIVTLDPQFVDAYYVAPEILIESAQLPGVTPDEAAARVKAALDLAKEGADNNPKSGIAISSYAQFLVTAGQDLQGALPYAVASLRPDIVWRSDEEQWDQFALLRAIFQKADDWVRVHEVQAVMDAIDANPNATRIVTDGD